MTVRSVDVDGVRISYSDVGEGPVRVALHGFTGDRSTMEPLADAVVRKFNAVSERNGFNVFLAERPS